MFFMFFESFADFTVCSNSSTFQEIATKRIVKNQIESHTSSLFENVISSDFDHVQTSSLSWFTFKLFPIYVIAMIFPANLARSIFLDSKRFQHDQIAEDFLVDLLQLTYCLVRTMNESIFSLILVLASDPYVLNINIDIRIVFLL